MSDLSLTFSGPVARLTLNRPERRNAMTGAMWRGLADVCAEIEARADVAVVIVEGAGGHFCSGADIGEFDQSFADLEAARAYLGGIEAGLNALAAIDRPTVACVEGSCVGGGLAVALACDLRFAAEDAHLAVPPAKLGLLYGPVETRLLVEAVGPAAAKDLLFSARRVGADEALRLGLVNRVLPGAELKGGVETYARDLTTLSGASIRGAKKAVRAALAGDSAGLRGLVETAALGVDFQEGRAAYQAKRAPRFGH
jgi:enoyl-CoA hydratase/carnithine racemase